MSALLSVNGFIIWLSGIVDSNRSIAAFCGHIFLYYYIYI